MSKSQPILKFLSNASMVLWALLVVGFPAIASAAPATVSVTDSNQQPLANAVVFLVSSSNPNSVAQSTSTEMLQRDTAFNPDVLAVQMGTSVSFPNEDPFRHHVYSFSDAKSFELRLYGGRDVPSVLFDQPGHVALGCNIHDNMLGHIYVVPTPYFAVTDATGTAAIPEIADGEYSLQVWHPDMRGDVDDIARVVVIAGSPLTETAEIRVRRSRRASDDFERFDY